MNDLLIKPNSLTGDHASCQHLFLKNEIYEGKSRQGVTVGILLVITYQFHDKSMHNFSLLLIISDYQQNGVCIKHLHLRSNMS